MTADDGSLRRATLDDLQIVASIHRQAFFDAMPHMPDLHTPEEDLEFYRENVFPQCDLWLAEEDGKITGLIALRENVIEHLYVHPDHQGRGWGRRLVEWAQAARPELSLWTFQCNQRARRFYERNGFRAELETDGRINDEKEPDVLYSWNRARNAED